MNYEETIDSHENYGKMHVMQYYPDALKFTSGQFGRVGDVVLRLPEVIKLRNTLSEWIKEAENENIQHT